MVVIESGFPQHVLNLDALQIRQERNQLAISNNVALAALRELEAEKQRTRRKNEELGLLNQTLCQQMSALKSEPAAAARQSETLRCELPLSCLMIIKRLVLMHSVTCQLTLMLFPLNRLC